MAAFEYHIFICTNTRAEGHPRGCCDPDGSAHLRQCFKDEVKGRNLKAKVRANAAGCLDQCEHGPNLVIYPEGVWYANVQPQDVAEIIDSHIVAGKPVERLRMPPECINTKRCAHKPRPEALSRGQGQAEEKN